MFPLLTLMNLLPLLTLLSAEDYSISLTTLDTGDPGDEEFEVDATHLQRRIRHLSGVLGHFWKQWRAEYLNELREAHPYSAKNEPHTSHVSQGDVVIVNDDSLPQGLWKLGRIQQLFAGQDGLPRSALVKVAVRGNEHTAEETPTTSVSFGSNRSTTTTDSH